MRLKEVGPFPSDGDKRIGLAGEGSFGIHAFGVRHRLTKDFVSMVIVGRKDSKVYFVIQDIPPSVIDV